MSSCITDLDLFHYQSHPQRKPVKAIRCITDIQFLSPEMIVPDRHLNLRHGKNLGSKDKMPEYLIKSKFAVCVCSKTIFVVKSSIVITNIKLVQMMGSKRK